MFKLMSFGLRRRSANVSPIRRPRPTFRPRLDGLEDRTVPSTLTVLNTADSGVGSLRDAIAGAVGGDTIVFDPHLAGQTITLTSGGLAISKNLDIEGLGPNKLTISGDGANRVFDVAASTTVTLAHLTIANGFADQGGGIDNLGCLTLSDCALSGNEALGDSAFSGVGGGIFNEPGASLTVTHSKFSGNEVVGGSGVGFGGGIFNLGTASIADSSFCGNSAVGGLNGYGAGGAICNTNNGVLAVSGCNFTKNSADSGQSPFLESSGGAIDSEVGTSLTVTDSRFTSNMVTASPADPNLARFAFAAGGAILTFQGTLAVSGSSFTGNQVSSTGLAFSGAIENQVGPSTITNCDFTANKALGVDGGSSGAGATRNILGTMDLTNCRFVGNISHGGDGANGVNTFGQSNGGAIFNDRFATMTMTDCIVSYNVSHGGDQSDNSGAPTPDSAFVGSAFGAGVFNFRNASLTISGGTFTGNAAIGGSSSAGPGASAAGGAIDSDLNSVLNVSDSKFTFNRVVGGAGAAGFEGGSAIAGAIINQFNSTATFANSQFALNVALGGAAGAGAAGGIAVGGALVNGHPFGLQDTPDASALTLTNSAIMGNLAAGGAGTNGGDGLGGGLFAAQGDVCLDHSKVAANLATGGSGGNAGSGIGGGLYIRSTATVGEDDSSVLGNFATTSDNDVFGVLNPNC